MSMAEDRARALGDARAVTAAARIEAEARIAWPELIVTRAGAEVTIAGRALARLTLDDPLLANPALLAAGAGS